MRQLPALSGARLKLATFSDGRGFGDVRIATIAPTGAISLGPVLFSYPIGSGTQPLWTVSGGSLWLFDWEERQQHSTGSQRRPGAPSNG